MQPKHRTAMAAVMLLAMLTQPPATADATLPAGDIAGAADTQAIGRFANSHIVAYYHMDYDELTLPLATLVEVEDARDGKNNRVFRPEDRLDLEGERTRLVYLVPGGVSPLQLVRNYQNRVTGDGGALRYECKRDECGGAADRSSGGGGGRQSLAMFLWPEERILEEHFSNGHCAQTEKISDQRYAVLELADRAGFVSVLAYTLQDDGYCSAFNGRTIAVVDVMQMAEMGDSMVVLEPEEMSDSIAKTGAVALYGIYFDTGRAEIGSASRETLVNIAALLEGSDLRLLVVGHTDSQGSFESNRALSERRATAVVNALVESFGINRTRLTPVGVSYAAPRSTNTTEEGRALNRRVELVEDGNG